jgi:hypothetical protein
MSVLTATTLRSCGGSGGDSAAPVIDPLADLCIEPQTAVVIAPIRLELLGGLKTKVGFDALLSKISAFEDARFVMQGYEKAAEIFNICRATGIQVSSTDSLVCAVALNQQLPIFSVDLDLSTSRKYFAISVYFSSSKKGIACIFAKTLP